MNDDLDKLLGFENGEDSAFIPKETILMDKISSAVESSDFANSLVKDSQDSQEQKEPKEDITYKKMSSNKEYPRLMGESTIAQDFIDLANRLLVQYSVMPYVDYNETCAEIAQLNVRSHPTPTLAVINWELEKIQASKDRLAEIFIEILKNYTFKKRAVDILRDSFSKFSTSKTADQRKSDAAFVVSDFEIDFAKTESLLKSSMHILKNLDSAHDTLSRKITVFQMQIKQGELGRSALPDFSFDKKNSFYEEISNVKLDEKEEKENSDFASE